MEFLARFRSYLLNIYDSLPTTRSQRYRSNRNPDVILTRKLHRDDLLAVISFVDSWTSSPVPSELRHLLVCGLFYDGSSTVHYDDAVIDSLPQEDLNNSLLSQAIFFLTGSYITFPPNPTSEHLKIRSIPTVMFANHVGLISTDLPYVYSPNRHCWWLRYFDEPSFGNCLPSRDLGNYFYTAIVDGLLTPHPTLGFEILSKEETYEAITLKVRYRPFYFNSNLRGNRNAFEQGEYAFATRLLKKLPRGYKLCGPREHRIQPHLDVLKTIEVFDI